MTPNPPPPNPPLPSTEVTIRLVGGPDAISGRVEVYLDGQWGTVCDDFWGIQINAKVVCRQLGLPWAAAMSASYGSNPALPILMDDVNCVGSESTLDACPRGTPVSNDCSHGEDVGE